MSEEKNVTAPAKPEAAKPAVSATIPVTGLVVMRGDNGTQTGFNLCVNPGNAEALAGLQALADHLNAKPENKGKTPIRVKNDNGEIFIAVKVDSRSKNTMKKTKVFDVNVTGTVRITGARGGQFQGQLMVDDAVPADILNGGRIVEIAERDRDEVPAPRQGRRGLAGFRP